MPIRHAYIDTFQLLKHDERCCVAVLWTESTLHSDA